MKILQINNCHYRRGGADVVYLNSSVLLLRNGHEVINFAFASDNDYSEFKNNFFPKSIDYRKLTLLSKINSIGYFFNNNYAASQLEQLIAVNKPDIAHIHLFLGGLTSSILRILKKHNIPVLHTVHDYRLICPAYTFLDVNNKVCEKCKDGFYLRCAFKRCSLENKFSHSTMLAFDAYYRKYIYDPFNNIDHFIFVSHFSRQKHIQFNHKFESKSSVLYNFRPGEFSKSTIRGNYLLYYGRLSREKGIETLIKSALMLNYKLKIVGTGPYYEEFLKLKNENIEVLGYKTGDELWTLIKDSSYVIVPSEWYENNPLTIVEAFSFGKPVIGADIGGISELVKDNRGFLFKPQSVDSLIDCIIYALACSDDEYFRLSNNVFDFAISNFTEEKHYNSIISIYKSSIND